MVAAVLGFLFIQEPPRNFFDAAKKNAPTQPAKKQNPLIPFLNACEEILVNPTCRWVCIAGSFRFFGGYAIGYYMATFFTKNYPDDQSLYSVLNAGVVSVGGFISAMAGGLISDRYESQYPTIKAMICM